MAGAVKTLEKAASPQMLIQGAAMFGSLVVAGFMAKGLRSVPGVSGFAMEASGALMAVGGAVLMSQKGEMRKIGATVGATGVATVAAGLAGRVGFPVSGEINISNPAKSEGASGGATGVKNTEGYSDEYVANHLGDFVDFGNLNSL